MNIPHGRLLRAPICFKAKERQDALQLTPGIGDEILVNHLQPARRRHGLKGVVGLLDPRQRLPALTR
ncbi:hypothetical protein CKO25_19910 [Thiocapsa imhoffii]|uniref:Uncharacterized protein n=1 Tax=Thiocapsa imhoffii TaxID=382777 RepID=A0A9X0WN67_9GAMM|nr:hypothetical protein [Thiocapsa imhoffii]MBK1646852.1 hypothetical protein [Thiocapsa imhoffii]